MPERQYIKRREAPQTFYREAVEFFWFFGMKKKENAELPVIEKTYDLILWYVPLLSRLPRDHTKPRRLVADANSGAARFSYFLDQNRGVKGIVPHRIKVGLRLVVLCSIKRIKEGDG